VAFFANRNEYPPPRPDYVLGPAWAPPPVFFRPESGKKPARGGAKGGGGPPEGKKGGKETKEEEREKGKGPPLFSAGATNPLVPHSPAKDRVGSTPGKACREVALEGM